MDARAGGEAGGGAVSAPTEAEIRAAILAEMRRLPNDDPRNPLREAVLRMADPIKGAASYALGDQDDIGEEFEGRIWQDLRTSEARRLREIVAEALPRAAARAEEVIVEELTAAGVRFAEEFPDAPRGKSLVSAAK